MSSTEHLDNVQAARPWDARAARWLISPLAASRITPNHLTTVRLAVGLAAAAAFLPGSYGWSNVAALLFVLSNFLDHTDGELARLSGKSSRWGHLYDLASDAAVTVLTFVAMGIGVGVRSPGAFRVPPSYLGLAAGGAIALVFYLRMRIEERLGKSATAQASLGGFETEDVLYLFPLVTLADATATVLVAASVCAPLFAAWVVVEYRRAMHGQVPMAARPSSG